jgi:hypothetical protein
MRKLVCHAEFVVGQKLTEKETERLIDEYEDSLSLMIKGLDLELASYTIYLAEREDGEMEDY